MGGAALPGRVHLPFLIISLVAAASIGVAQSGSTSNFSTSWPPSSLGEFDTPIMLVHGYDPYGNAENDGSQWDTMISVLEDLGWEGGFVKWGYYGCDATLQDDYRARTMSDYGSHEEHLGGSSSHGTYYSCGEVHDRYARIEHLGYHFAWAVYERFTEDGECVAAIGHSMGGLIIRYALAQVERGHSDFPSSVCIKNVITWGSPHAGSDWGGSCVTTQRCSMMTDSAFIEWLDDYARHPQGTGGTDWTVVGSNGDEYVSPFSATRMDARHVVIYEDDANMGHSDYYADVSLSQSASLQYWNEWQGAPPPTADGTWYPIAVNTGYWPVAWGFYSLAYTTWGCGSLSQPWPIPRDVIVYGERSHTGKDCHFELSKPSFHTDVVVQLESLGDVGLGVGSEDDIASCSRTAHAASRLCHLQDVDAAAWEISADDQTRTSANRGAPFAVRATSFANQPPTVHTVECASDLVLRLEPLVCTASATDDSPLVQIELDWGDGSSPEESDLVEPGVVTTFRHSWSTRGDYSIRFVARDNAPENPLSSWETYHVLQVVDLPSEPTDVSVRAGPYPGQIQVSWQPPIDDGGTDVIGYRVFRTSVETGDHVIFDAGPAVAQQIGDQPVYSEPRGNHVSEELPPGTSWTYTVTARTEAGEGPPSEQLSAKTWAHPDAPRDVTAVRTPPRDVRISWLPPSSDGGAEISRYVVYSGPSRDLLASVDNVSGALTSYLAQSDDESAVYAVSAANVVGEGILSEAVAAQTAGQSAEGGAQGSPGEQNELSTPTPGIGPITGLLAAYGAGWILRRRLAD